MKTALRSTALAIVLVALTGIFDAHADCPLQSDYAAPHTRTDFVKGGLVYDLTNNQLKTCDGTNWNTVAAGSGLSGGTSGYLGVWTGATSLGLSSTSAGNQLYWDGTNHRLGIGTTAPLSTLHVNDGTGTGRFYFDAVGSSGNALIQRAARSGPTGPQLGDALGGFGVRPWAGTGYTSGATASILVIAAENQTATAQGNSLNFTTMPIGSNVAAQRMVIDPAGNVGIGTASPSDILHLKKTSGEAAIRLENPAGNYWTLWNDAGGSNFAIQYNGSSRVAVLNGGNVGIGTAAPAYKLDVAGSIRTDGNMYSSARPNFVLRLQSDRNMVLSDNGVAVWNSGSFVSDRSLKKDIEPIKAALDLVKRVDGVTFKWRDDTVSKARQIGFIAQDIEKIAPEIVYDAGKGLKGIYYDKTTAILWQAVKEFKAENDKLHADLKAANDNQAVDLKELRREIEALKAAR